ncbi:MAG: hypothetical protein KF812_09260 [Fimbriimonadaceae bacterium]|nr:hypothetical protein [Fimbriimonadaceae bacterium]
MLLVLTIVVLLTSLVFPALIRSKSSARVAEATAYGRQIGMALAIYGEDFQCIPPTTVLPYLKVVI